MDPSTAIVIGVFAGFFVGFFTAIAMRLTRVRA